MEGGEKERGEKKREGMLRFDGEEKNGGRKK